MSLAVEWAEVDGVAAIRVSGCEMDDVRVYPARLVGTSVPPMAGRWDGGLFVPRFGFVAGTSYSVVARGQCATIARPAAAVRPRARVLAVYPSGDELPRNALRLYVHFSHPMREGGTVRAFEGARQLEDVFVPRELWDPDRRRLTVLLDPGRIKRGLVGHQASGYPLREGADIRLAVEYLDAGGAPMREPFCRTYAVGPDVRERVLPERWRVRVTRDALEVVFDRPLDRALLRHALTVEGVRGRSAVGACELSWRFTPSRPWSPGAHRLVVRPVLEDVAGNSLTRVFDRDLGRLEDDPGQAGPALLDFVV